MSSVTTDPKARLRCQFPYTFFAGKSNEAVLNTPQNGVRRIASP